MTQTPVPSKIDADRSPAGPTPRRPISARCRDMGLGAAVALGVLGWVFALSGLGSGPEGVRAEELVAGESPEYLVMTESSSSGTALVFVLNTRTQVLNVYEAEGGSRATRGLSFVASRKIARDIHVTGYNDRSEYSYQDLLRRFELEEARQDALDETEGG